MSGLDVNSMDLFGKKKAKKKVQPVAPVTPVPVEVQVKPEPQIVPSVEVRDSISTSKKRKIKVKSKAKYDKYTPVTARITEDLYMDLKRVENQIMRSRSKSSSLPRERITTNSVLRCLISSFIERVDDLDLSEVQNEDILRDRIEDLF